MGVRYRFRIWLRRLFRRKLRARIGIYGPTNSGKTTLANRILMDWCGEIMGSVSEIPHETRRVKLRQGVEIYANGIKLRLDILDTPGLATKIDARDFLKYGLSEAEAYRRAKEATEGVIEAIRWIDQLDGVLLVLDSTQDPYTQVNIMMIGNMEARGIPMIIVANKIDLPNAVPSRIKSAFPQHTVIPISALNGQNLEMLYRAIAQKFG